MALARSSRQVMRKQHSWQLWVQILHDWIGIPVTRFCDVRFLVAFVMCSFWFRPMNEQEPLVVTHLVNDSGVGVSAQDIQTEPNRLQIHRSGPRWGCHGIVSACCRFRFDFVVDLTWLLHLLG